MFSLLELRNIITALFVSLIKTFAVSVYQFCFVFMDLQNLNPVVGAVIPTNELCMYMKKLG